MCDPKGSDRDERVTMHGLDPVDALRALLQVDPDAEPVDGEDDGQPASGEHGPRRAWGPNDDGAPAE